MTAAVREQGVVGVNKKKSGPVNTTTGRVGDGKQSNHMCVPVLIESPDVWAKLNWHCLPVCRWCWHNWLPLAGQGFPTWSPVRTPCKRPSSTESGSWAPSGPYICNDIGTPVQYRVLCADKRGLHCRGPGSLYWHHSRTEQEKLRPPWVFAGPHRRRLAVMPDGRAPTWLLPFCSAGSHVQAGKNGGGQVSSCRVEWNGKASRPFKASTTRRAGTTTGRQASRAAWLSKARPAHTSSSLLSGWRLACRRRRCITNPGRGGGAKSRREETR